MRNTSGKQLSLEVLVHRPWPVDKWVVLTNGCFDILHRGHVEYLEAASQLGDLLVVGINSDDSVHQLKGPSRPINSDVDRARVVAALECVAVVTIFDDQRVTHLINMLKPHVWVKGGDYTLESLCQEEVEAATRCGTQIKILPLCPGYSTTETIKKLNVS